MSRHTVGDRVYALAGADDDVVRVFGPGTYVGRKEVPMGRGFLGIDIEGHTNHCIDLDTGERVFGHECWWGTEDAMRQYTEGRDVVTITVADYYRRREATA